MSLHIRKIRPRRKRMAILIDTWFPVYDAKQVRVAQVARHLSEDERFEVHIYTRHQAGRLTRSEQAFEALPHVHVHRSSRWVYGLNVLTKLLFSKPFDLVHAHDRRTAFVMKVASWFKSFPTLVTVHSHALRQSRFSLGRIFDRVLFQETRYSAIISASEEFLDLKNLNTNVTYIPSGVDPSIFEGVEFEKKDRFTLLYVGKLTPEKGLFNLIESLHELVQSADFISSNRDLKLHLVGTGILEARLKEEVDRLGLERYVKFNGKVTEEALHKLYLSSDLFVFPVLQEGLPYTLLKACAAGLPILATNVGDLRKLVRENVNGHLVPAGNVEEFSFYLKHFASNPHILEEMGNASRALVQDEFQWDVTLKKTSQLIRSLTNQEQHEEELELLMPWEFTRKWLEHRSLRQTYKGRKALKFCLTVNVEASDATNLDDFLERFSEFTATLELPSTLFFSEELLDDYYEEIKALSDSGHEIALKLSPNSWQNQPERRKTLRLLREKLETEGYPKIQMIRTPSELSEHDYLLLHEYGFEELPVSEDPVPRVNWRMGLPFGSNLRMDLEHVLQVSDEDFMSSVNHIRRYQCENEVDPFIIFEASSLDFFTQEDRPHATGENFSKLSQKLRFLSTNTKVEFQSLDEFYKSILSGQTSTKSQTPATV